MTRNIVLALTLVLSSFGLVSLASAQTPQQHARPSHAARTTPRANARARTMPRVAAHAATPAARATH